MLSLAARLKTTIVHLALSKTGAASMGILDDAIREHLDLKRQVGAREAEIKQLEDEAFGPPARPGDPEFGEPEDTGAELSAVDEDRQLPAAHGRLAHPELEDTQSHAPFADEDEGALDATAEPELEASSSLPPVAETEHETEPESAVAESEPQPPTVEAESEPQPPTVEAESEPQPPAEPELDAEDFDVGDLSLAIDDDSPLPEEDSALATEDGPLPDDSVRAAPPDDLPVDPDEPPSPGPPGDVPAEPAADAGAPFDAEAFEDEPPPVRHDDRGAEDEAWLDEKPVKEASPSTEPHPEQGAKPAEQGEDLLEETPEFLRDAPESDELWFEQGKPQDFDFEDED